MRKSGKMRQKSQMIINSQKLSNLKLDSPAEGTMRMSNGADESSDNEFEEHENFNV